MKLKHTNRLDLLFFDLNGKMRQQSRIRERQVEKHDCNKEYHKQTNSIRLKSSEMCALLWYAVH